VAFKPAPSFPSYSPWRPANGLAQLISRFLRRGYAEHGLVNHFTGSESAAAAPLVDHRRGGPARTLADPTAAAVRTVAANTKVPDTFNAFGNRRGFFVFIVNRRHQWLALEWSVAA
jgi:hypothetical protein